ncbi:DUF1345 domain-containing protein [Sphingomonas glacialis]|uniref:DUF1345 domain-containing protein n=1 Tax=Sphingomonas glacialis TaxID=658225 RepID=A0A502FU86_9SPHN|nr:DUF1345 domain-containing protein [Sphingomonas glacialis]TPG53035.1 DUF1345 domain-containing protein [Sphingomonas glacialis]
MSLNLGKKVAPPRFILFAILFAGGLFVAIPPLGWGRGAMAAFDVAAAVFLLAVSTLLGHGEADRMRKSAEDNDANRVGLLVLTGVTMLVILTSVAKELQGKTDIAATVLVIVTLVLAWLFSNTVYALHYAHLFYSDCDDDGQDSGGLDFPKCAEPDYWDFLYFSFTLGMTFQTSDVEISSRRMRRVSLGQCLAAFVFNIGVLAFTINVLGSSSGS